MEKRIARFSYWLGFACLLAAVFRHGLKALGVWPSAWLQEGSAFWSLSYLDFSQAALMLLLLGLATASLLWINDR